MLKDVTPRLTDRDIPSRIHWSVPAILIGLLLVVFGQMLYHRFRAPRSDVPVPPNPAALDPLLRQYVAEKAAWVRESPDDATRQATLGLVYAANALWPQAAAAFDNAARLNPREPLALLYQAIAQQELGQSDRALSILRDLTARFPDFAPGFYRLGDYSLRLGNAEGAGRAFQRLVELAPGEWRGYSGLGEVQLRQGHVPEAVALLEKAARIEPTAKPAHALLGQAYQRSGRTNEAARELALGMNASHYPMPDAWSVQAPQHMRLPFDLIEMAQGYIKSGAPAKAIAVLKPAAAVHQEHPNLLVTLAEAYVLAGQPQQARPILDHVLQLDPSSVAAYVALSGCNLALGRTHDALSNATRAITLGTNCAEAYVAEANAHLALDQDKEAVAALESAHRYDSNNPQVLLDRGDILWRNLNQTDEALHEYRQAVLLDPSSIPAHLRLAQLLMSQGDREGAVASLEAAQRLAPTDPSIARALEQLKRKSP